MQTNSSRSRGFGESVVAPSAVNAIGSLALVRSSNQKYNNEVTISSSKPLAQDSVYAT